MRSAFPIVMAVLANVVYHTAQKLTSAQVNPFLTLGASFATAAAGCFVLYLATGQSGNWRDLSWTAPALGLALIAIETGFLLAYRQGWKVGLTALVATVALTLLLVPIGRAFFGERLTWLGALGAGLSLAGLGLITLQAAPR